jgi:Predicted Fe-S-cluster oxidoreductase
MLCDTQGAMGTMTDIDFTPLKGLKFNCLEGCGFCCSFPAEVRECEKNFPVILEKDAGAFRKWDDGHPYLDGIYTFKQHNDRGACIFLNENKRCDIYDIRALLCRTFPVKFFFGWRLQLYPSMSCRGFSEDECSDMVHLGKEVMAEIPADRINKMLDESKAMYSSLPERIANYVPPEILQKLLREYVDKMVFEPWNISEASIAEFEAELSSGKFIDLPTYLTEDLEWQVFKLEDGFVRRILLNRTGETENIDRIVYSNLSVKTFSSEALETISRYLRLLASTDHFIGVVYHKAIEQKADGNQLSDMAISEFEKVKEIFLLKASLLAEFEKWEHVNEKTVEDAIVLYDGYLATLPAFGMIL